MMDRKERQKEAQYLMSALSEITGKHINNLKDAAITDAIYVGMVGVNGAIQQLASLVGSVKENGDEENPVDRISPASTLFAALLAVKCMKRERIEGDTVTMKSRATLDANTVIEVLTDVEKLIGEPADKYLSEGMVNAAKLFVASKDPEKDFWHLLPQTTH